MGVKKVIHFPGKVQGKSHREGDSYRGLSNKEERGKGRVMAMREKDPSRGGAARAAMQTQGTEQRPRGGGQMVGTGWKLSCQEVGNGELMEFFKKVLSG